MFDLNVCMGMRTLLQSLNNKEMMKPLLLVGRSVLSDLLCTTGDTVAVISHVSAALQSYLIR